MISLFAVSLRWLATASCFRPEKIGVYFGSRAPTGRENNWVQAVPGTGWNTILRLYGHLELWFTKT